MSAILRWFVGSYLPRACGGRAEEEEDLTDQVARRSLSGTPAHATLASHRIAVGEGPSSVAPTAPVAPCATAVPDCAFGKKKWLLYFGMDVGEEPQLPPHISSILEGPSPSSFETQSVRETHILVLVPKTVNEIPFTLDKLDELVQAPRRGSSTKIDRVSSDLDKYVSRAPSESHWVLMAKEAVPGSRNNNRLKQSELVAELVPYCKLPSLLDACTGTLIARVMEGVFLYPSEPSSFVRVQEAPLAIGGFGSEGLRIVRFGDGPDVGVAACITL